MYAASSSYCASAGERVSAPPGRSAASRIVAKLSHADDSDDGSDGRPIQLLVAPARELEGLRAQHLAIAVPGSEADPSASSPPLGRGSTLDLRVVCHCGGSGAKANRTRSPCAFPSAGLVEVAVALNLVLLLEVQVELVK